MKKIIEDVGKRLESFLGERITVWCMNYIYTGKLVGVNDTYIKLSDCGIVYETGSLETTEWKDMQKLPYDWYIQISAIEAFGKLK